MPHFTRTLWIATAVLALGSSMANAQSYDQRHRDDPRSQAHRPDNRPDYRHDNRPDNRPDYRHDGRPDYRPGFRPGGPSSNFQSRRGAGPNHNWYRGTRMPPAYRTQHYVVNDWRMHHLTAPPRGYYWVQNGADYLLIAIATGVIAQIILSQ
ncbi:RcnB family protein [Simplicispira psychrophila]|uniref:RcnB family protein n=1 Tax=Simplicispira psychrophila TaxID=80882 RepID=UPI001FE01302|nr:RcnB family protein [Simplicispira psychrophila]